MEQTYFLEETTELSPLWSFMLVSVMTLNSNVLNGEFSHCRSFKRELLLGVF